MGARKNIPPPKKKKKRQFVILVKDHKNLFWETKPNLIHLSKKIVKDYAPTRSHLAGEWWPNSARRIKKNANSRRKGWNMWLSDTKQCLLFVYKIGNTARMLFYKSIQLYMEHLSDQSNTLCEDGYCTSKLGFKCSKKRKSKIIARILTIIPSPRVVGGAGRPTWWDDTFKWQVQLRQSSQPLHLGDPLCEAEQKPHQLQSSTVRSSVPVLFLFSAIWIKKKHVHVGTSKTKNQAGTV